MAAEMADEIGEQRRGGSLRTMSTISRGAAGFKAQ